MRLSPTPSLTMVSGKGGVGKTTFACGLARQLGQRYPQERILLVSTDPAHSLADVLQWSVGPQTIALPDQPNVQVRALDAPTLLAQFRADYGPVLEQIVERGSLIAGDDLGPVWDMGWPGLDELMALLEIERILRDREADRVVVDMAPSGHTLALFALMDFLDTLLAALDQFQAKHRYLTQTLAGHYTPDQADTFLQTMEQDLQAGRDLIQDPRRTACWVVAIPEPLSLLESQRLIGALGQRHIPVGGLFLNRVHLQGGRVNGIQAGVVSQFRDLAQGLALVWAPLQAIEPVGGAALDALLALVQPIDALPPANLERGGSLWPAPLPPGFEDFVATGRRLLVVGGKGGVGKTTVAAAIGWAMGDRHPDAALSIISIDPAHSLGDAFGQPLGHEPTLLKPNLQGQEVNAAVMLDQFREDYLWELADLMGGDSGHPDLHLAYGPEAWRQIVAQALPGLEEMLALITVMDLLERNDQQLIVLDTAPTGHLLRFLAMPTALADWLGWIFKLWIKYQDVVGRVEFMGRLRTLRQRVMAAQAKLKDPQHTEFIGVVQHQTAILAEAQRLNQTLDTLGIAQRYIVHNRYEPENELPSDSFPRQTILRIPVLPPSPSPLEQVKGVARLIFPASLGECSQAAPGSRALVP